LLAAEICCLVYVLLPQICYLFFVISSKTTKISLPNTVDPIHLFHRWLTSPWSDCSVSCGHGEQSRQVFCVESYAGPDAAPSDHQQHPGAAVEKKNGQVADQYCWQLKRPVIFIFF
jgi:hypothetical protein